MDVNKTSFKILFAGDYHSYGDYNKFICKNPKHDTFSDKNLKEIISSCDLRVFNLENPLTKEKNLANKFGPHGIGSEESLNPISLAWFNVATIATNHIYDAKNKGIEDTIRACSSKNIETVGAGLSDQDASKILYKKINSCNIAILNFSRIEFNTVSKNHGGANPLDPINNSIDIQTAKKNADLVFVVIHDGVDLFHLPYPKLVKQVRFYADMGADAIILHHSRYISGYEVYKETPIFYGLGNLLNLKDNEEEKRGLLVRFDIDDKKRLSFELIPIITDIENIKVSLPNNTSNRQILNDVENRSSIIKDKDLLDAEWINFIEKQKNLYLSIISYHSTLLFRIAFKLKLQGLLSYLLLLNKKKYLAVWNIFKCQSHFEATNEILDNIFFKNK